MSYKQLLYLARVRVPLTSPILDSMNMIEASSDNGSCVEIFGIAITIADLIFP